MIRDCFTASDPEKLDVIDETLKVALSLEEIWPSFCARAPEQ